MKYIYIVLILAALWGSVGYGKPAYMYQDLVTGKIPVPKELEYKVNKWRIEELQEQLTTLKAEVEALRKMIGKYHTCAICDCGVCWRDDIYDNGEFCKCGCQE